MPNNITYGAANSKGLLWQNVIPKRRLMILIYHQLSKIYLKKANAQSYQDCLDNSYLRSIIWAEEKKEKWNSKEEQQGSWMWKISTESPSKNGTTHHLLSYHQCSTKKPKKFCRNQKDSMNLMSIFIFQLIWEKVCWEAMELKDFWPIFDYLMTKHIHNEQHHFYRMSDKFNRHCKPIEKIVD